MMERTASPGQPLVSCPRTWLVLGTARLQKVMDRRRQEFKLRTSERRLRSRKERNYCVVGGLALGIHVEALRRGSSSSSTRVLMVAREQFPFYNEARSGNWYDFGFLLGAGYHAPRRHIRHAREAIIHAESHHRCRWCFLNSCARVPQARNSIWVSVKRHRSNAIKILSDSTSGRSPREGSREPVGEIMLRHAFLRDDLLEGFS